MLEDDNLKAVCSVTQMAKKLGLSRVRLYQLQKMGVFPKPVYLGNPRHPFYTQDLQQKCLNIRKTGIGENGLPIIFYGPRKNKSKDSHNRQDYESKDAIDALSQMGLKVGSMEVKNALMVLYPKGLPQDNKGGVIGDLFRYFSKG